LKHSTQLQGLPQLYGVCEGELQCAVVQAVIELLKVFDCIAWFLQTLTSRNDAP